MKSIKLLGSIAVLVVCLASIGRVGSTNAVHADARAVTAEWSHVSVACVPDDTGTWPGRYDALTGGRIKFQGTATGNLWFWCNVLSPLDAAGANPSWNALFVTFKDSNNDGYVQVKLIRKRKDDGRIGVNATFTSSNGEGVREEFVPLGRAFDFATYAYYVRVQLHRDTTMGDPEFHIVTLRETMW